MNTAICAGASQIALMAEEIAYANFSSPRRVKRSGTEIKMKNLFSIDGGFFGAMDKLANVFWLNILFLICCLPIFTIGASTTAMFYVTLKMVRNEDCYITKSFFRSFKQNFKQATGIWILAMIVGGIFFADMRILQTGDMPINKIIMVIVMAMSVIYTFVMTYIFPLLAKFDNTVKNTIRNALLMSIRHFPWTVLLIVCIVLPFILSYFILYLVPILLLIGGAGIAYGTSFIYMKIFDQYISADETAEEMHEDEETGEMV